MTDTFTVPLSDIVAHWDAVEVWADVEGHPGYYVSSWGNVRGPRVVLKTGDLRGYKTVCLWSSEKNLKTSARVHRLVALAFIGPAPFIGAEVAHNDGNRSNNRVSNLRWASALENQADRIRHETKIQGSEVFGAKLDEAAIPHIRERIKNGERYPSIARDYGVSISTISLIKLQRTWTHV